MNKTKILIVDDRSENIMALSALISNPNLEIHSASNSEKALNLILDHDFALALLDVQMPETSGFDLARLIRGIKKSKNLPIIFVTAQSREPKVILESYEAGAVDLLFKPLEPAVVKSKVQVFVTIDQQNRLLQTQMHDLEILRHEAEMANVAKSRFLANMSHEIRTPLGAVLGFVDVLAQDQLTEKERQECLSTIRRNGHLLLRLIDDILDFSKIEAERLELENSEFNLRDLLADVESTLSFKAAERGISLEIDSSQTRTGGCIGDALRIKQVLLNIIGNAIKFTQKGFVKVTLEGTPLDLDGESYEALKITVADSGTGMTREQIDKLFQPFSQADASTRRHFGGTGLGLVISKQLAKSMNGDLILKSSQPGKGTVFEISLRIRRQEREEVLVKTESSGDTDFSTLHGRRILVVDDVKDNRNLIERILGPRGVHVSSASSGVEALSVFEKENPDLILMDIQMPGQDGYESTELLRERGFTKPIIALTAHAMKDEKEKCRKSGCNTVLTKPVHRGELLSTLKRLMS